MDSIIGRPFGKSWDESKKIWHIALPAILTAVFQFSIGFVTTAFVGHLGEVELAAVAVVENVIEGFAYGILVNEKTNYVRRITMIAFFFFLIQSLKIVVLSFLLRLGRSTFRLLLWSYIGHRQDLSYQSYFYIVCVSLVRSIGAS